jgi:cobalt-zinc-cadmium efflux system membrane fusion protein
VQLTPEKFAAADLHTTTARMAPVQLTRPVPATITYDAARRVPVNSPVAGVVGRVLVEPGQQVAEHQPLAELSSPEVGLARDEVLRRSAEQELARRQLAFSEQIAKNVEELLAQLAQKPKLEDLERTLAEKTLGEYREKVVAAYSKLVLAEATLASTGTLETGTLSKRLVEERRSSREVAAAQLSSACETARFAAAQDRDKHKAAAEQAERLLSVAQQTLANLLGPLADMQPVTDRQRLSELVLLAPIAGKVEERTAVQAARASPGAPLFVLANTQSLWVSAEIHERDWAALEIAAGSEIAIRVPALNEAEFTAKVKFFGGQVAAETRSVPLIAELPNPEGRLKPGLYAWALVPLEKPRDALVVPASAIMRNENQPFVFVPAGERTYRRIDVTLGLESGDLVEILSGLKAGDTIVDRGAFFLKSELLLEREE